MLGRGSSALRGVFLAAGAVLAFGGSHAPHAAGMRCFDNLPVSEEVRAGQGAALIEAGFLDVTRPPYRADPTGATDAAPALQRAITDGYEQNLVVHVPKGTYLVGTPLVARQVENFQGCGASNRKHGNQIVGAAAGDSYPVLKAKAGAFIAVPLLTLRFEGSLGAARHYAALVRGLTIDMGANPRGHGLSLEGAQLCAIEDVLIRGDFDVGITGLPGSGGSTTNVKVVGGTVGIRQRGYRPTPSLQGVQLLNQRHYGIELVDARGGMVVAGFRIEGSGEAGVRIAGPDNPTQPRRNLVMADGQFRLSGPAILGAGNAVFLRNIYARTSVIVANGAVPVLPGRAGVWTRVTEFATTDGAPLVIDGVARTGPFRSGIAPVAAPPGNLLARHAWDPARMPSWFNTPTLDIRDFGATPDFHEDDDAPAINRALADSARAGHPAYVPRGRFNVRQPIEVPAGAAMLGSSYTNSIIYADERWQPTSPTALLRTEDAEGGVLLMDFAANGQEPAPCNAQTANNMLLFHGRTSNLLLRDVQINRREWWQGQIYGQTVGLLSGHAGGRIYNMPFDFRESTVAACEHHLIRIDGTSHPLAIYQADAEGALNDPQVLIRNAANVTVYGFKFENSAQDSELLRILDSRNIAVLGGSGNYAGAKPFVRVDGSRDVTITALARQGTVTGPNILEDGIVRMGPTNKITTYKKGRAVPFGELKPPGFPYPQAPQL